MREFENTVKETRELSGLLKGGVGEGGHVPEFSSPRAQGLSEGRFGNPGTRILLVTALHRKNLPGSG